MAELRFLWARGEEIGAVVNDLAGLRIAVFRDYPYLYEGSVAYEKEYLTVYTASSKSLLFSVYDGDRMVGATTCLPLADESAEVRRPFEDAGYDISTVFYFGESILLREYRGLGLGHRFFDEREAHARTFGNFETSCFCSVDRGENHPLKPADYRSNNAFWTKRGYHEEPELQTYMSWPDVGDKVSTAKKMIFWIKKLRE
ncbi:GNAT family N-acetyltransferase [Dyadobacter luticola]|uniref:GNAT family N-acetyltransferase n=1 Tax=Dyadobacter luticola TaxID=1979387 RepID=A0A5R9KPK5_9BACT|nr:GNAT family N-acetyltransferase [Dyadobacter luticola]TLU98231.1 GNAT family N-acetyltransferase [Dyadobacter luticola]